MSASVSDRPTIPRRRPGTGTPAIGNASGAANEPRFDYSAAEEAAGIPPEPDPATWRAYIDALIVIDPAIVDDEEQAVDRPGHPDGFGAETSTQILAVVRQYLCPGH